MNQENHSDLRWLAAASYIVWPLSLAIVLTQIKSERFLRFHGYQSLALGICGLVLYLMLGLFLQIVPVIGVLLYKALIVLWLLFEVFLAYRCFQGESFRIPWLYDMLRGVME